jgi:23S rRNA (cytosine1962-C5)-methyltransferase
LTPAGILARNDVRVRQLEGLDSSVALLHGDVPPLVTVRDGRIEHEVDLWHGQKTGLFLDQRENRAAARSYARGRLLDGFSYHGAFALQLADRVDEAVAIDISEDAVGHIRANAARNGVSNLEARAANVFDALRHMERGGERFDTIVLDPPAFAKNKDAVEKAWAGYKEINLRAMKLLRPGGVLVTCTCSYHVDEYAFGQIAYEASVDARVRMGALEKRMQSRDHPILLGVPETYYLKCLILRKLA